MIFNSLFSMRDLRVDVMTGFTKRITFKRKRGVASIRRREKEKERKKS